MEKEVLPVPLTSFIVYQAHVLLQEHNQEDEFNFRTDCRSTTCGRKHVGSGRGSDVCREKSHQP